MALVLTEEQELLKQSATDLTNKQWELDWLRSNRSLDSTSYDAALWQQMIDLGWTALPFEEQFGGLGLGFAELGVVLEELGKRLVVTPLLSSIIMGGSALSIAGNEAQKAALIPGVCDGSQRLTLAYQESARHDPYRVSTTLSTTDVALSLNGAKTLVLDGDSASMFVVLARSSGDTCDREGLTLVLVDAKAEGVSITPGVLLDSRRCATVSFDNVSLDQDAVLGDIGNAADAYDEIIARSTVALCADMLGGIQASFDLTVDYLKEREQFGAKIGSFQGLKHRAARWFCEVELTRSIVMDALRAIDEARDKRFLLASTCKSRASDTYMLSGTEGIQMHGGMGMTDEADIGFYLKRARASEQLLGDGAFHRNHFAELKGY